VKPLDWILRGLVLAGLAILFIPSIPLPRPGTHPRLVLLVDASLSMSSKKKQQQYQEFIEELKESGIKVTLDAYMFSDSLASCHNSARVKFEGRRSDIHAALGSLDYQDADAVLLVSDGRHNGPEELEDKILPVPLYVIAIGARDLPDIGIEEVEMIDSAQVRIRLRSNLNTETTSKLTFYKGDRKITEHKVRLAANGLTELTIPASPIPPGTTWRLELDSLTSEDRLDNNSFVFHPYQRSSQLEVLFVAGTISQETELILESLRALPGIELSTHIEMSEGRTTTHITEHPDVLVVGPLRTNLLPKTQGLIRDAVKQGTPLLFISSAERAPSGLRNLFPVEPTRRRIDINPPWQYSPFAELLIGGWHPEVAEDRSGAVYVAKPEAETLVGKDGASFIATRKKPVRTVEVELPDLASAIRQDREGFASFIRTTLAYLVEGEGFPFRFRVDESTDASLRLELYSEVEVAGGELEAWLLPDSHVLNIVPMSANSFRASGTPPVGVYRVNISWNNQRFAPQGEIKITQAPPEQPSQGANYELLAHLAHQNSGELIAPEEFKNIIESLPKRKSFNFKPLKTPFVVVLIGIAFLVEIWYRRKKGLP
jgi:hypothetical protein